MKSTERKALQEQFNQYGDLMERQDAIFQRLQELNRVEGTGKAWCSALENAIDLLKCGKDYMSLYTQYAEIEGMMHTHMEYGQVRGNIMTRYQCEKKIGDLMIQIDKVYHEYNPDGKYLHISIVGDVITANNSIHDEKQLDMCRVIKRNETV